jgi:uncharacterized protein
MKPRNLAGPVVRGPDFWGRDAEVEDLWRLLDRGHVLLNGPRRYGKSSLMYALFDNPREEWHPIYMDLESVETAADFVTTLGAELLCQTKLSEVIRRAKNLPGALRGWLASWIQEVSFQSADVGEVKLQLRKGTEEAAQLSVLADQLLAQLRGLPNKTAILFDEFPMMVAAMLDRDQGEGLRFLKWFRASRQNPGMESVSFLVGGSLNIEPRLERLASESLLGDLQRFRLSPMSYNQSLLFIEEVFDAEEHPVETGVPEEILRIARTGVHYYLQVIIQECLGRARQERRKLLVSDVGAVYSEKVVGPEGRHRFSHYHTRLRSYGANEYVAWIVLDYLCRNASASVEELAQLVAKFGADSTSIDNVMVRLEGDYYVVKEGARYRFSDGLIKDWWIRNSISPSRS